MPRIIFPHASKHGMVAFYIRVHDTHTLARSLKHTLCEKHRERWDENIIWYIVISLPVAWQ